MGLLKNIKRLFNKNIECGNEIDDRIIFLLKKNKPLYFNKNIYVKENNACVIVYKGKVTDVIFSGKYRVNKDSIPETYSKAKIDKLQGSGVKVKKIKVDIFYVNLTEFKGFEYWSDIPFKTKSDALGKIKGCLSGLCSIKVLDGGALVRALKDMKGKLSNSNLDNKIGKIVGNKINTLIKRNKIDINMLFNNQNHVESILNADMQDALDKSGIFISNIKLKAIKFTKKYQKKVNEHFVGQNSKIKSFDVNASLGNNLTEKVNVSITKTDSINIHSRPMQIQQKVSNVNNFVVCSYCKKRNSVGSKICTGCGNHLN